MTNVDLRDSERQAIRAHARSAEKSGFWVSRLALLSICLFFSALVVVQLFDPSRDAMVLGLIAGLVIIGMTSLSLSLANSHRMRVQRVESRSPHAFVMPLMIAKGMPEQAKHIANALGSRPPSLTAQRHALFAVEGGDIRIVSGSSADPDLIVPRFAVRSVGTGMIDLPGGSVPSIDIGVGTPVGTFSLQLFVMRRARFIVKPEPLPVLEQYVAELRLTLGIQPA